MYSLTLFFQAFGPFIPLIIVGALFLVGLAVFNETGNRKE